MKTGVLLLFFSIAIGTVACATDSELESSDTISGTVRAEVVHAGGYCGGKFPEQRITQIATPHELNRIYSKSLRTVIGDPPQRDSGIDFSSSVVLLIEMGQRPTLGYGLKLVTPQARMEQGRVQLLVEWIEPSRDMTVGQALTSPCLILKLERGEYSSVLLREPYERYPDTILTVH